MSPELHLLPQTSTPFEMALSAACARTAGLPVPIRDLWRPDSCPASHLPWLAWALSVDIWDDDWPLDKKRSVLRQSFELHRIKGTLGCIRRYVDLSGSSVYRALKPPAKNFLGASTTPAEREAHIRGLPAIRIYTSVRKGNAGKRGFWGAPLHGRFDNDLEGTPCWFPSTDGNGPSIQQRAEYRAGGTVTPVPWSKLDQVGERVFIPGANRHGVFSGKIGGHYVRSTASKRVVTLDLTRTSEADLFLYRFPVVAGLEPAQAVPFREFDPGFAPRSVFCGTPIGRRYFVPSVAPTRTYDVVHLRSGPVERRQAINYMGTERFGLPPHTGELTIAVTGQRPKWVADRFVGGHFYAAPKTKLKKALSAVRASKSARDDIFVSTQTYRPLRMGTPLLVGAPLVLGTFTRS